MDTFQDSQDRIRRSLKVPDALIERMKKAFDSARIQYELDEDAIRSRTAPNLAVFDFAHDSDMERVQALVDNLL
jgi:hypothetical protein